MQCLRRRLNFKRRFWRAEKRPRSSWPILSTRRIAQLQAWKLLLCRRPGFPQKTSSAGNHTGYRKCLDENRFSCDAGAGTATVVRRLPAAEATRSFSKTVHHCCKQMDSALRREARCQKYLRQCGCYSFQWWEIWATTFLTKRSTGCRRMANTWQVLVP